MAATQAFVIVMRGKIQFFATVAKDAALTFRLDGRRSAIDFNQPVNFSLDPGTGSSLYTLLMESEHTKQGFLRAGELARAAGVSTDTLRHYERMGALARPRRSANGYREYPPETLARVRLVRRALAVGFTLEELARLFRVRDRGGAPCREARELAATKLAQVEEQLEALLALRDELRATLAGWDARLARAGDGAPAGLLETLAASVQTTDNGRASHTRRPLKKKRKDARSK